MTLTIEKLIYTGGHCYTRGHHLALLNYFEICTLIHALLHGPLAWALRYLWRRDGFQPRGCYFSYAFKVIHGLVIHEVMHNIKSLGTTFRYAIIWRLHKTNSGVLGEEHLL